MQQGMCLGGFWLLGKVLVGSGSIAIGFIMGQAEKGRISVCLVCRSYGGINVTVRSRLGLLGGWRNIGSLLDSKGVE